MWSVENRRKAEKDLRLTQSAFCTHFESRLRHLTNWKTVLKVTPPYSNGFGHYPGPRMPWVLWAEGPGRVGLMWLDVYYSPMDSSYTETPYVLRAKINDFGFWSLGPTLAGRIGVPSGTEIGGIGKLEFSFLYGEEDHLDYWLADVVVASSTGALTPDLPRGMRLHFDKQRLLSEHGYAWTDSADAEFKAFCDRVKMPRGRVHPKHEEV